MVGEAWMPKNQQIQQRISANYRHINIVNLPNYGKMEILTFVAKTKNSTNPGPDKFELYEIIREKQNDECQRSWTSGSLVTAALRLDTRIL